MSFSSGVASTSTPSLDGGRSFVLQGSRGRGRALKATRGYAAIGNFGTFGTRAAHDWLSFYKIQCSISGTMCKAHGCV